ncbi:MAG: sigma-70 family RNA polymerase sigma factor [Planctomycetaceae bacterium]|nr:sigma-70 family RNA polymerase sigma factor [Planctomycetaceae bacterium]
MMRVTDGDHQAFETLMERYQNRLIGFFFHLVRDRTQAEDMAQEVFLRVYRSRENYSAQARFSTWLFRIAHNLASNYRRGMARRREVPLAGSSAQDEGLPEEDRILAEKSALMPTRQLDSRETQEIVREALDTLNDRQRMAVLLHKFEGMSYQDIGDIMGLNVIGVKSLLSRARGKLKESLERHL